MWLVLLQQGNTVSVRLFVFSTRAVIVGSRLVVGTESVVPRAESAVFL